MITAEQPDVALVDYQMPDLDGLQVVHAVVRDRLRTRVLLLSAITDSAIVFSALEQGAAGYLGKDSRRSQIVDAVLSAAKGKTVVPPELAGALAGEIRLRAQPSGPVLSEREMQVLRGFARGQSIPQTGCRAVHRCEHRQDAHPAAVREAGRVGPRRGRRRGHAPGPARVGARPVRAGRSRRRCAAALCSNGPQTLRCRSFGLFWVNTIQRREVRDESRSCGQRRARPVRCAIRFGELARGCGNRPRTRRWRSSRQRPLMRGPPPLQRAAVSQVPPENTDTASVPVPSATRRVRARLTRRMSGQRSGPARTARCSSRCSRCTAACTRRPTSSWCSGPTRSPRRRTAASSGKFR